MITTTIMNYISQAIILIFSLIMYTFITGKILPLIFLRPSRRGVISNDRGIKRYAYEDGRAIVYKPTEENNKYIEQYILSAHGDEKFIKCKIHEEIRSLEYDVIVFDSRDKVVDVISVKDPVKQKGTTGAVSLPLETSYVSVTVRVVNRVRVTKKPTITYSYLGALAYSIICSGITVGLTMGIQKNLVTVLDQFLNYTQRVGNKGGVAAFIISAIISFACFTVAALLHSSDSIKIKNDSFVFAFIKKIFIKMRGVRHGSESTANFKRFLSIFSSK